MLKANIGLELISGHQELERFMSNILKGRTEDELKRQAGILGKTIKNNAQKAHSIVNASFHNATFSDRIWQYQSLLKADLSKLLQTALIQGKNPRAVTSELRKHLVGDKYGKGATYNAERLMRTELARVQTDAQKQSFERNGFDMYTFIANKNPSKQGTCEICKGLDGKHFKVEDMMPGKNAPPMHPNCRCSTAAYEDSQDYENWLDFLDKGGTTEEYNKLKKSEKEESKTKYAYKDTVIDSKTINSPEYRRRIDQISENTAVNRSIWNRAVEMLQHRTGTKYEDLAFVDSITGKSLINKDFNKENCAKPSAKMEEMLRAAEPYTIIGVHNHPGSKVPSIPDFKVCIDRKYNCGVVLCHNGKIYKYKVDSEKFNELIAASALDRLEKIGYNTKAKNMFTDAGIEMEVL